MSIAKDNLYSLPNDAEISALLGRVKTIAVVGLSPKENRPSHHVSKHMQQFGYRIIPVRPAVSEILGEKAYASLQEIPIQVDLVNVFRASKYVADITEQCIDKNISAMWLQEGVIDLESANKACSKNMFMIMDKCIYREYLRLMK